MTEAVHHGPEGSAAGGGESGTGVAEVVEPEAGDAGRTAGREPDSFSEVLAAQGCPFVHDEDQAVRPRGAPAGEVVNQDVDDELRDSDGAHAGVRLRGLKGQVAVHL